MRAIMLVSLLAGSLVASAAEGGSVLRKSPELAFTIPWSGTEATHPISWQNAGIGIYSDHLPALPGPPRRS